MPPQRILFACVHNAGRSQMAAALFNALADPTKAEAFSAGTRPATVVHAEVIQAMREMGIELAEATPQLLTADLARRATMLITMGCGEECPYVPGLQHDDWGVPDPKGRPMPEVRAIREEIRGRVAALLESHGWGKQVG
jgi:arsenate reductase (thioredoxin)